MADSPKTESTGLSRRFLIIIAVTVALAVFLITWFGIRQSRKDSFELLVMQGTAFTEALSQASRNAITSEMFYDRLVQQRYSELTSLLSETDLKTLTEPDLVRFAQVHDLIGVYIYGMDSNLVVEGLARGPRATPPEFVQKEVDQLIANPESNYVLLLDNDEQTGQAIHYYLELSNRLDRVIVLSIDALYYSEALKETGIGYLAQNMAREKGVVYIIYQSTDGIIFASRKPGNLLAIESDPFLSRALESDTIDHRVYEFQGQKVLELVRPFATDKYPFGLFRVGLSLDGFYSISRGFDRQMAILAVLLFGLLLVLMLYVTSREKRKEISRRYTVMRSVTERIFDQMQTGVGIVDANGILRMANRAFETVFDINNATGKSFREAVPPDVMDIDAFTRSGRAADETEVSFTVGNEVRKLLVARSIVTDESTGRSGVILVVYDITRLREFEQAAARRERLSEMGNLAAGVAHEIRNPLNTISIAAQRLASEFVPEQNKDEYLSFTEKIRSETRRLNEIITRFLALAREEKKQRAKVALPPLIDEVSEFVRVEAEKVAIKVETGEVPDVSVEADRDKLKQVFLNLFNNTKEALAGKPGRFQIRSRVDGRSLDIQVCDDGPGIASEIREKVFSPYFTTKETGTGLGLATIHQIVADIGGDIRAGESEWGGACFTITLPLK
jgi:PAS domain S-box-containing protein